ncbi:NYN domain-containing protein [Patescibacteria group bacterium]|nr:NYN domain-containing protein [Patescibacteria group bacterium]MBU4601302.1 NYN domain-containing protein [Patescibacteria group bacterium]
MTEKKENNFAFVDGQNLHMGTKSEDPAWQVDFFKFREYLKKKYNVTRAYYFLGFTIDEKSDLYDKIQESGFILKFR